MSDSTLVRSNQDCPDCGSSRGLATYSDGHTYCHKCHQYTPGEGGRRRPSPQMSTSSAKFLTVTAAALPKRGISEEACRKLGYGLAEEDGRRVQVAEFRDSKGRLVGQKVRYPDKRFRIIGSTKTAVLFGQHAWKPGGRMVAVTEGELDALSVSDSGDNRWPVVSLKNGAGSAVQDVKDQLEWLESFEKVIFMFDQDEPGQKAAQECAEVLSPGKAYIADLPLKDASDMLQAGRGSELVSAKFEAKPYRPDGIITGREAILEKLLRPIPKGLPFPHSGLQAKLQGLRQKEFTLVGGGPGSGKSELVRHFAVHFAREHEVKVGYIALEEDVQETLLSILSPEVGRPLRLGADPEELTMLHDEYFPEGFVFYEHESERGPEAILSKMRYMSKGLGCDLLILDHITLCAQADMGEDERLKIDSVLTGIRDIRDNTRAHVMGIAHLRHGIPFNTGHPVEMEHFKGSGNLSGIPNNMIGVERNQQAEDELIRNRMGIRVLKNRTLGWTGFAGHMQYDPNTRRFAEVVEVAASEWEQ